MKAIYEYGYDESTKFQGTKPKIIELLGSVGTVENADKIDTSIFSSKGKLNTTHLVSPNFVNPGENGDGSTNVTNPDDISNGDGNKKLISNISLDSKSITINGTVEVNLNGNSIVNTMVKPAGTANPAILVKSGSKLTISGNGKVDGGAGGDNSVMTIEPSAEVSIENGSYSVGGDADGYGNSCIYLQGPNSVLEVTGGEFRSLTAYKGQYYVLNSANANKDNNMIIVKGGKFWDFDPSNADIETPAKNYVPEGYKVTSETVEEDGQTHTIYTVSKA